MSAKNGDWVTALEGIGQLISVHSSYIEEFQLQRPVGDGFTEPKKNLGDWEVDVGVYKLFCSFDGVPRRRFAVGSGTMTLIEPLTAEYQAMLDSAISRNEETLDKFNSFRSKKVIGRWCPFWIQVSRDGMSQSVSLVESIFENLKYPFTFDDVLPRFDENGIRLDYRLNAPAFGFIRVNMFNKNYQTRSKRKVFTDVSVVEESVTI